MAWRRRAEISSRARVTSGTTQGATNTGCITSANVLRSAAGSTAAIGRGGSRQRTSQLFNLQALGVLCSLFANFTTSRDLTLSQGRQFVSLATLPERIVSCSASKPPRLRLVATFLNFTPAYGRVAQTQSCMQYSLVKFSYIHNIKLIVSLHSSITSHSTVSSGCH